MKAQLLSRLRKVLPLTGETYELHVPSFRGREEDLVLDCIRTGWVSSVGKYVDQFEDRIREFTGVSGVVATSNGTSALAICLRLLNVGFGDEVLMPALTFVATANAASHVGAIPHFVDSSFGTLGVCPEKLRAHLKESTNFSQGQLVNKRTQRPIKALVAMHTFGHSVDIDGLIDVCEEYKLPLIEDAAESLGTSYKGKHTGNFGVLAALSFNGNKIITTGGGGAILSTNMEMAKHAKHLTTTAKLPHPWRFDHDEVGYNYRLPNLNAALGCAQMDLLPKFLKAKIRLAENYRMAFDDFSEATIFEAPENSKSNYWLNCLLLKHSDLKHREEVLTYLHENKIKARPAWTLMHHLPMFESCPRGDLTVSEDLERRLICLPSSPFLAL